MQETRGNNRQRQAVALATTPAACASDIEIVVIGGRAQDFTNSDSETLNLSESSWKLSSEWQLPVTRDLFGCAWSDTHGIVVAGGRLFTGPGTTARDCSRGGTCPPTTSVIARKPGSGQQWVPLPGLITARFRFAMVALDDNRLLAVGGQTSESNRIYSVELFDGRHWQAMQSMPQLALQLNFFDATFFAGEVYVTGYSHNSRPALLIFNVDANSWRAGPEPITDGLSACAFGKSLHIIGENGHQRLQGGKWHEVAPPLVPRRATRLTEIAGRLYVIGGYELRLDHQRDVESFDGTTWRREPTMHRKRFLPGVIVLNRDQQYGTTGVSTQLPYGAGPYQSCPANAYLAEMSSEVRCRVLAPAQLDV